MPKRSALMSHPGYRIFVLDFAIATLCGWLVYLFCKYGLSYTQHFLAIDVLNEFDKVAMATCAAFVVIFLVLRTRNRGNGT
jgi:hypothetical protein